MSNPNYEKPTSQVDLEARLKDDYESPSLLRQGESPSLESANGYIGVDPIYQNFANETEKPLAAEKGVEKKLEAVYYSDDTDFDAAATPQGEGDAEDEEEKAGTGQDSSGNTTTPQSPATPPQS